MILIDEKKSIIAGEGKMVMAELAATLDRFCAEVVNNTNSSIEYDQVMEQFLTVVAKARKLRAKGDFDPTELVKKGIIEKDVFSNMVQGKSQDIEGRSIDDLLKKAEKKLKKKMKEKKDKKNKKDK